MSAKSLAARQHAVGLSQQNLSHAANIAPTPITPTIISRLHGIIEHAQAMNTRLEDLRAKTAGEPMQSETNERAALPPQSIESLLCQIEQIQGDNRARIDDLFARF